MNCFRRWKSRIMAKLLTDCARVFGTQLRAESLRSHADASFPSHKPSIFAEFTLKLHYLNHHTVDVPDPPTKYKPEWIHWHSGGSVCLGTVSVVSVVSAKASGNGTRAVFKGVVLIKSVFGGRHALQKCACIYSWEGCSILARIRRHLLNVLLVAD